MNSKTNYVISIIIVALSVIFLIREISYDFSRTKLLYASFYPDEYFEKDLIKYENQIKGPGSGGRGFYYYYGTLEKNKKKAKVFADENFMKKLWAPNLEIPVWYCKLNGSVVIRDSQEPPKPISYNLLNSQMNILMWILFLPAIVYIIRYQIQKRKSKSLPNNN